VPPDALVPITLSQGDDGAIPAALDQVTAKILGQTLERSFPDLSFQASHTFTSEVPDDTTVAVVGFFTIVKQPSGDERRNATLLGADRCMSSLRWSHFNLPVDALEGGQRRYEVSEPPSPTETTRLSEGQVAPPTS
jgi:hypothetical protein